MGETNQSYPIMEVAIACETLADLPSGHERKNTGDIIMIRPPGTEIGVQERSRYLWLCLEGLEQNEFAPLDRPEADPDSDLEPLSTFDKRRYCIPLERIEALDTNFDKARALDPADTYQPYAAVIDDETGEYLVNATVFQVSGLVYDKHIGDYL